jgi:heptosyltransferase-2
VTAILVRLPNHVGDACMAVPALRALQSAGLVCALVGRPWAKSLLAGLGCAYTSITGRFLTDLGIVRSWTRELAHGELRGVVLPNSFGSALLFALAGVRGAGLATAGRSALLRWPIAEPRGVHEVERFHAAASGALGAWRLPTTPLPVSLGLPLTAAQRAEAEALLRAHDLDRYALLAPVATGRHHGRVKHWSHFADLLPVLREHGLRPVAAPPPTEIEAVRAALPDALLLPSVDLGIYAALAERAAVVIANDSGSSHVAAAVGARQVTIFGVTDRSRTGPWSPRAVCVGRNGHWPEVGEVVAALDQALALP